MFGLFLWDGKHLKKVFTMISLNDLHHGFSRMLSESLIEKINYFEL